MRALIEIPSKYPLPGKLICLDFTLRRKGLWNRTHHRHCIFYTIQSELQYHHLCNSKQADGIKILVAK